MLEVFYTIDSAHIFHIWNKIYHLPLVSALHDNICVDNVLVKIAPDLNQPLLQFITALDVCMVNTFMNSLPYLTVKWVEIWAVWSKKSAE